MSPIFLVYYLLRRNLQYFKHSCLFHKWVVPLLLVLCPLVLQRLSYFFLGCLFNWSFSAFRFVLPSSFDISCTWLQVQFWHLQHWLIEILGLRFSAVCLLFGVFFSWTITITLEYWLTLFPFWLYGLAALSSLLWYGFL